MKAPIYTQKNILNLCKTIYPKDISKDSINIPTSETELVHFAQKNRLIHFLASSHQSVLFSQKYIHEFNLYTNSIKKSLQTLGAITDLSELLVIKTFSSYPHETSDLDILAKNKKAVDEIKKIINEKKIKFPIETDINYKISWTDTEEISNEFIWSHVTTREYNGIKISVPNPELDVLIRIAHMPFELAEVRLGELMHIYKQSEKINWNTLEKEARDNSWIKTFEFITAMLNEIHLSMYNKPWSSKLKSGKKREIPMQFPVPVPYTILAYAVLEKRAWKKLWGARYILKDRLGL